MSHLMSYDVLAVNHHLVGPSVYVGRDAPLRVLLGLSIGLRQWPFGFRQIPSRKRQSNLAPGI